MLGTGPAMLEFIKALLVYCSQVTALPSTFLPPKKTKQQMRNHLSFLKYDTRR